MTTENFEAVKKVKTLTTTFFWGRHYWFYSLLIEVERLFLADFCRPGANFLEFVKLFHYKYSIFDMITHSI